MRYEVEEIRTDWRYADDQRAYNTRGYHLNFNISNATLQLTSPASASGNGPVELLNALNDPSVPVNFYPIYGIDSGTINYNVVKIGRGMKLAETEKTLISSAFDITVGTEDKLSAIPTWLNTHKTR